MGCKIKDNNEKLDKIYGLFSDTVGGGIFEIIDGVSLSDLKVNIDRLSIDYQEIENQKQ